MLGSQVVKDLYYTLEKGSTLEAQRAAALCVGILSKEHLHTLAGLFFERQVMTQAWRSVVMSRDELSSLNGR